MTKTFLKQNVKDLINAKLREVLVIRQDGQCEYPAGWDDVAIAKVLGGGVITEIGIKRLRQANFGRLYSGPKEKPRVLPLVPGVSQADFNALVARVTLLEEVIAK